MQQEISEMTKSNKFSNDNHRISHPISVDPERQVLNREASKVGCCAYGLCYLGVSMELFSVYGSPNIGFCKLLIGFLTSKNLP